MVIMKIKRLFLLILFCVNIATVAKAEHVSCPNIDSLFLDQQSGNVIAPTGWSVYQGAFYQEEKIPEELFVRDLWKELLKQGNLVYVSFAGEPECSYTYPSVKWGFCVTLHYNSSSHNYVVEKKKSDVTYSTSPGDQCLAKAIDDCQFTR
jgi:hypothetical protein